MPTNETLIALRIGSGHFWQVKSLTSSYFPEGIMPHLDHKFPLYPIVQTVGLNSSVVNPPFQASLFKHSIIDVELLVLLQ